MKNNIQKCVFCDKPINNEYYFALDENNEIIVCCEHCYNLAKLFIGGPK